MSVIDAGEIKENMEVVGADGVHVGKVDHVDNDRIKLNRTDAAHGLDRGHHHYLPLASIGSVDNGKVWMSANASEAAMMLQEKDGSPVEGV